MLVDVCCQLEEAFIDQKKQEALQRQEEEKRRERERLDEMKRREQERILEVWSVLVTRLWFLVHIGCMPCVDEAYCSVLQIYTNGALHLLTSVNMGWYRQCHI